MKAQRNEKPRLQSFIHRYPGHRPKSPLNHWTSMSRFPAGAAYRRSTCKSGAPIRYAFIPAVATPRDHAYAHALAWKHRYMNLERPTLATLRQRPYLQQIGAQAGKYNLRVGMLGIVFSRSLLRPRPPPVRIGRIFHQVFFLASLHCVGMCCASLERNLI